MNPPNHTDLSRDMGRVEASLEALEKAMMQGFKDTKEGQREIKGELETIRGRLDNLETSENKRKGAVAMLVAFGGVIGGLVVKFGALLFGAHS